MVIAINATFLQTKKPNNSSIFLYETLMKMAVKYHNHQFIFIFSDDYDKNMVNGNNIISVLIKSKFKNSIAEKYWYNFKLPNELKKRNVDVLLQLTGYCSTTIKTPQLLFLQDSGPAYQNKKFAKKSIAKAKSVALFSSFSRNEIVARYDVVKTNVTIINAAVSAVFKPLNVDEIFQIKDGFAEGREYFLYISNDGNADNIMNTLKAFSLFKKWQRSNMKLLVDVTSSSKIEIIEKLKNYKYRDDVVVLDEFDDNKLAKIIASAYCVLIPSLIETTGISIMKAMQSGVPVIASSIGCSFEIAADAILYINPNSVEELAEKMQVVYKDENLRSSLIKDGLQHATKFNIDYAVELLWNSIVKIGI